ncbi:hypothetical protein D3C80_1410390 [compost metagenome]
MADDPDLHGHDVQLLTDFLAHFMLAATTGAGQFVLGQCMDDINTRQLRRQGLALATAFGRFYRVFVAFLSPWLGQAFSFVE